jgi:hypothetical protein
MKIVSSCLVVASIASAVTACTAAPDAGAVESANAADSTNACTPATQADALAHALAAPIKPPRFAANLDLAGDDNWSGLKEPAVETVLCAGTEVGPDDPSTTPDPQTSYSWGGDSQPIYMNFSQATAKATMIQLDAGYTGSIDFKSRDGAHTYSAKVGAPIMKDGTPMSLDWTGDFATPGNEVIDALVATFAPSQPAIGGDCRTSGRCLLRTIAAGNDGSSTLGIIGSRDVHFYLAFPGTGDATAMSTSSFFYMFALPVGFTPPPPPNP